MPYVQFLQKLNIKATEEQKIVLPERLKCVTVMNTSIQIVLLIQNIIETLKNCIKYSVENFAVRHIN